MNSLSKIGLLCTVIAAVVMVPGVAVGECDYIGALEGYSLSEFEYSGLDQAAIDAAPSYVLPEGGTVDIDLPPFGDVVHLVGGTECGPPGEFWVLWDHEDASTYSWPDGPSDQQQGGGDGVGDDPYGLYMIMGETRTLFTVVAGGAGGGGYPTCVSLELDGDTVTMTWRDDDNLISDGYEVRELWTPSLGLAEITPGAAGSATFAWDPDAGDDDFAQLVLDEIGCEDCYATESRIYFAVPYEAAEERIDMGFDTLGEAIAAGGSCEGAEAPPEPSCAVAVSSSYPIEGESFSIELDCTSVTVGSVEWFKDDVSITGKPPSCITMSPTDAVAGDTVTLTAYDEDGAEFDLSDVWVVESNFAYYGPDGFLVLENPAYDSETIGDIAIVDGAIEVVLTQEMLDHTHWDLFLLGEDFAWESWNGLAGFGQGEAFATVADAVAAGGAACVTKGDKAFATPFGDVLEFDPLEASDDGVYTGVVNDGEFTVSYTLDTLPAGSVVPVTGLVGLGLLIGLGAIGGALRTRKR